MKGTRTAAGLLAVLALLPGAASGALVNYTLTGTLDFQPDVDITSFPSPGEATVNFAEFTDGFGDTIADLFGGGSFSLSFTQDTDAVLSQSIGGPPPTGARYGGAITGTTVDVDGSTVATGAGDDFFAFTSNQQHQWSIFSGAQNGQGPLGTDFDGDLDFDFDGENFVAFEPVSFDGFDLFLIDRDETLFTGAPPNNAPFIADSFDQPDDFTFIDFVWRAFFTAEGDGGTVLDFDVEVRLSGAVETFQSSAVPIPLPGAAWLLGPALLVLGSGCTRRGARLTGSAPQG